VLVPMPLAFLTSFMSPAGENARPYFISTTGWSIGPATAIDQLRHSRGIA